MSDEPFCVCESGARDLFSKYLEESLAVFFEQLETFIQYDICAVLLIRDKNQSAAM